MRNKSNISFEETILTFFPNFEPATQRTEKLLNYCNLCWNVWWQESTLRQCSTATRTRPASACVYPPHLHRSPSPSCSSRGSGETSDRPESDHELLHLYIRRRSTPLQWSLYIDTTFSLARFEYERILYLYRCVNVYLSKLKMHKSTLKVVLRYSYNLPADSFPGIIKNHYAFLSNKNLFSIVWVSMLNYTCLVDKYSLLSFRNEVICYSLKVSYEIKWVRNLHENLSLSYCIHQYFWIVFFYKDIRKKSVYTAQVQYRSVQISSQLKFIPDFTFFN